MYYEDKNQHDLADDWGMGKKDTSVSGSCLYKWWHHLLRGKKLRGAQILSVGWAWEDMRN